MKRNYIENYVYVGSLKELNRWLNKETIPFREYEATEITSIEARKGVSGEELVKISYRYLKK